MRALISGIVGAAISAVAWLGVEHYQQTKYGWLVILVGVVTGLFVNKAGSSTSSGFARGALALVLALAGIVGGQKGYAKFMEATISTEAAASAAAYESEIKSESEESETEASTATETPAELVVNTPINVGQSAYTKSAMKKNFGEWDMIWMCVAALVAYVTGKGGDKIPVEAAEAQAAPESGDDE